MNYSRVDNFKWFAPKLSAIQFAGGVGGQTLGLQAARFQFHGIFEHDEHAIETLRASGFRWFPRRLDIKNDMEEVINHIDRLHAHPSAYGPPSKIDLFAASLPWRPWDGSRSRGLLDPNDRFDAFRQLVLRYKPNAFLFETVIGFINGKHREHYLAKVDEFAKAGYRLVVVEPFLPDFGLPRENDKIFVIGIKKQYAHRLHLPVLRQPVIKSFVELVAPVAFRYRSAYSRGDMSARHQTKLQRKYDAWCEQWLASHRPLWNELLPRLNRDLDRGKAVRIRPEAPLREAGAGRPRKERPWDEQYLRPDEAIVDRWLRLGFDIKKRYEHLPVVKTSVGDLREQPQSPQAKLESKLPMTPALLKRLQGFPDDWQLRGPLPKQFTGLLEATPPVIALALGRAIHAALTDKPIDINSPGGLRPEMRRSFYRSLATYTLESEIDPAWKLAQAWHEGVLAMREEIAVITQTPDEDPQDAPEEPHYGPRLRIRKRSRKD